MFAIFPTREPHVGILEVRDRAISKREKQGSPSAIDLSWLDAR